MKPVFSAMTPTQLAQDYYDQAVSGIHSHALPEDENSLFAALEVWRKTYSKRNGIRIRRHVVKKGTDK